MTQEVTISDKGRETVEVAEAHFASCLPALSALNDLLSRGHASKAEVAVTLSNVFVHIDQIEKHLAPVRGLVGE